MNSNTARRERAHRAATQLAREMRCAVCGRQPCVPAHYKSGKKSGHRGMGSGKAGWEYQEDWWPLCVHDHDLVDGRLGVSKAVQYERDIAIRRLERHIAKQSLDPTEL